MLNNRNLFALSIPSAEPFSSYFLADTRRGVDERPVMIKMGRKRFRLSLPIVGCVRRYLLFPLRWLQTLEEFSIGWTIDLEQAKGALFRAEERVVNRHKRTGHFAFKFSDGRFTRPHQGALDRFKRRF